MFRSSNEGSQSNIASCVEVHIIDLTKLCRKHLYIENKVKRRSQIWKNFQNLTVLV